MMIGKSLAGRFLRSRNHWSVKKKKKEKSILTFWKKVLLHRPTASFGLKSQNSF